MKYRFLWMLISSSLLWQLGFSIHVLDDYAAPMLGYGIAELFRLEGTSWALVVQAPLQAGTVRAGCPGLYPVGFWLSPQSLWETCCSVGPLSQWPSLLQECISGSQSTWCPQIPQGLSLQSYRCQKPYKSKVSNIHWAGCHILENCHVS